MAEPNNNLPKFICDAMMGGLARWLRAAGYDAEFEYGIDDRPLVARAQATGRILLSCDGPMFERNVITSGRVHAVLIPRQLNKLQQLRFVMSKLDLPLARPRCMACGGELDEVPKHTVADEAPPLAFRNCRKFFRCRRCAKLLWHGTHWQKITRRLDEIRL